MNQNDIQDSRRTNDEKTAAEMNEAEIDDNLENSFPASDPPSWTLGSNHHRVATGQEEEKDKPRKD
jgi:hypothetical protein